MPDHQQKKREFKRSWLSSISLKIIMISALAVISFVACITVMYIHTESQASLLVSMRDKVYPVKSKTESALFTLKMVQVQMERTVLTGEIDSLNEADRLKALFEKDLEDILRIDSTHNEQISEIKTRFEQYFTVSRQLALTFLNLEEKTPSIESGKQAYTLHLELIELLEAFEKEEKDLFSNKIKKLTDEASTIVELGLPIALITIAIIFFLSFTTTRFIINRVNNIVSISRKVAEEEGDMSVRIKIDGNDEMTELAFWFNQFINKLEKLSITSTKEIRRLAYTDALSGLPNRRLSNMHLQSEIENCQRDRSMLALIFLDLDNFKQVNDHLGHDAGDMVVCEVARRLKRSLRKSDVIVVQPDESESQLGKSMVARIGGDEFMIIIPKITDESQIAMIAKRIKNNVLEPIKIMGVNIEVGVSMGIAVYPDNGISAKDLTINADIAMYDAKNSGKNTFKFFTKELSEELNINTIIEGYFKKSFKEKKYKGISFHYQPKMDLESGCIVGAEALIRVNHTELGELSPDQFIPILENSELIFELDKFVIDSVCRQISSWIDAQMDIVPISINISAHQACRENLAALIAESTYKYNLPPGVIEIEITETSALRNFDALTKNIKNLEAISVKVALDDFGAGHASLTAFTHCKINTLKIDRQFIDDFRVNKQKLLIVKGIIDLAKSLNMTTVAEGIETKEQHDALLSLGCDIGQGFFLSRPVTAQSFSEIIETHEISPVFKVAI